MTCWPRAVLATLLLCSSAPVMVAAQSEAQAVQGNPTASRVWIAVGGGFTTMQGSCSICEESDPHRRGGSVLGSIGYPVNSRVDIGGEVFWSSIGTSGSIYTTHLDAVARFRPWSSSGFFLTGGAGMAFVRNWVDEATATPITSKTLSIVVGAGWALRPTERVGFQVFGAHHAAAFGDLPTPRGEVGDVLANFWSVGAAIVIR